MSTRFRLLTTHPGRTGLAGVIVLLSLLCAAPRPAAVGATRAEEQCFPQTGFCARGRFLDYWRAHGGLAINGYPLSGEFAEILEDGKEYTVQYFERARFEYHPENTDPAYQVLLGQFGRRILREDYVRAMGEYATYEEATKPVPGEGPFYFAQTGHTIAARFRDYWAAYGGLAQFGYPITEERWDGGFVTQYFERARFEWHTREEGTPYVVQLGQFGRRILEDNALLAGPFGALYRTIDPARAALGRPQAAPVSSAGATQAFERGRMYWVEQGPRGGKTIFAFCGDDRSGQSLTPRDTRAYFADTWAEGQAPGGGPGPVPGLYEPAHGFGKIWRAYPHVRECLGYARTATETSFPALVQLFDGGAMLLSDMPEGRYIYVLKVRYASNSGGATVTYARYAAPAP